jgi:hypothetical protein
MVKPVQTGSKKPYSSPKLTVYGTVRDLTHSHNTIGNRDNARRPARFTRLT